MPDDLRGRLLRDLSRRDLQTTVHMVHAWLVSDPEVLRQESSRPPRRRGLLAAWLRAAADTDLHDPLLIDALDGRGPDRLGLRRSPVERLQRFVRDPALVSGAVALALAATVMWIQPLYVDMPMPRAAPAPNTDPGLDQASEASASKVDDGSAPTSTAPAPALAATSPSPLSSVVQAAPQTVPPQGNVPTGGAEGAQAARYRQAQIEGRRLLDSISPNDDASLADVFDAVNDAMKRGDLDAVRKEAANWEQRLETEHFIDWSENRKSGLEAKEFFVYFPIEQAVVTPEIRQVVEEAAGYAKQGGGKLVVAPIYRGETPTIQKRRADLLVKALASAGVPSQAIVVGDTAPLAEPPRSGDGVREPLQRSFRIDVVFDR
jgi:outer membrane protein OmpA-like peptidoglycan-associated protein